MGQTQYVVKYNDVTDLYLVVYNPNYNLCQWGSVDVALTWDTLQDAQNIAASINSGTSGVPRPH